MIGSMASRDIRQLFDAQTIARRNASLVEEIKARKLENLLVVAVLKGSFVFAADLLRAMYAAGLSPNVEFLRLSSYSDSTVSSGAVTILPDIERDVRERHVLLVADIL